MKLMPVENSFENGLNEAQRDERFECARFRHLTPGSVTGRAQRASPAKLRHRWILGVASLLLLLAWSASPARAGNTPATAADFAALGNAVADLLQTRDTGRFATNATISVADLQSILAANAPVGADFLVLCTNTVIKKEERFAASARALLAAADALHVDFSHGDWRPRVIGPTQFGNIHFGGLQAEGQSLTSADKIEVVFTPDGSAGTNGDFRVAVHTLLKFPAGWRAYEGVEWEAFPDTVGDKKTPRELAILHQAEAQQGLSGTDDPALLELGKAVGQFLQTGDMSLCQRDVLINANFLWSLVRKSGQPVSLSQVAAQLQGSVQAETAKAALVLQQMTNAGVDFSQADLQIKNVAVEGTQVKGLPGSLDGVVGGNFTVTFAVTSNAKSKTGVSLTGDYTLTADTILRAGGSWRIVSDLRWSQFPANVMDAATQAKIAGDNYIAAHHALPPGTLAPDIEFTTVAGEKKMKLSALRGRVVVLDFWATWCGPCQQPLADLQHLRGSHPDWKNRVAIVPVSIDDSIDIERQHLLRRGWTNTFNVWGGEGGGKSATAQAFEVSLVPTTYIIDSQGKIVASGRPSDLAIPETVDNLLK